MSLIDAYRQGHTQAHIPIFVADEFDSRLLVEACVEAGYTTIEYTLRRQDCREMIPWIRRNYPDLTLLVGSTLDDERIVRQRRQKHPQLMTIDEVAELDVHGFISMVGWREETIAKWSQTHLVMPAAMTVNEALFQVSAGAHFVKTLATDLAFNKRLRGAAAFDYCPILSTGGVSAVFLPQIVAAGAVITATGFDLMLKGHDASVSKATVVASLRRYLEVAQTTRAAAYPELYAAKDADTATWLDSLPHFHPF